MTSVLKQIRRPFLSPYRKNTAANCGNHNARRRRKQRLNSVYIWLQFLNVITLNYLQSANAVFKPLMIQPLYFFGFNIISRDNQIYPIFLN